MLLLLLFGIGSSIPPSKAELTLRTALDYTLEPLAYENAVLAVQIAELVSPRIAIDRGASSPFRGTTYLVGLREGPCARPFVVRSYDHGLTWEAPRLVDLCLTGLSLDVVVDGTGSLYVTSWGPKVFRSVDRGSTWSLLLDLGNAMSPAALGIDDATGALYVGWAPSDVVDDAAQTVLVGPLLIASSRDGGRTWTSPLDILAGAAYGSFPQIAVHDDSVVVTAAAAVESSDPFVVAVTSQDGGRTWSRAAELSQRHPCAQRAAPSVAVSPRGEFAVSWHESGSVSAPSSCWTDGGASAEILVSSSRDGGRSFAAPVRAGGPVEGHSLAYLGGRLTYDGESRLFVVWDSISSGGASVHVSYSATGEEFEEAFFTTQLAPPPGNMKGHGNLAVGPEGAAFLAWREESSPLEGPSGGIFVRRVSGQAVGEVRPSNPLTPNDSNAIQIELRDRATGRTRAPVAWTGSAVVLDDVTPGVYDLWLRVDESAVPVGALPVLTWGRTSFTIRVEAAEGGFPSSLASSVATFGIAAAILVLSAILAGMQYTRIEREDVLQRKIRVLMYDYVRDHPGASYSAVRDAMGLKNGVATYHLGVLERQGLLHSESRRRRRWYFADGDVSLWRDVPISPLQQSILNEIGRNPGIGIRALARALNRHTSSVADNVKGLSREGTLRTERVGRKVLCFPATGASSPPESRMP